jgi:hypothetical protein
MPIYRAPDSDSTRLAFMKKAVKAAALDSERGAAYVDAPFVSTFTAHYEAYATAYANVQSTLGDRVIETAESQAALNKLRMYVSHAWVSVYHRAQRLDLPDGVLEYYMLNADGSRPVIKQDRESWESIADQIIKGDANAVLAGYVAMAEPTAVELQTVLDASVNESGDVLQADRDYDEAQETVATFRDTADELIRELRDLVVFATRKKDAASQRRILRSYGAKYRYLPGEAVDEGDVVEGAV